MNYKDFKIYLQTGSRHARRRTALDVFNDEESEKRQVSEEERVWWVLNYFLT